MSPRLAGGPEPAAADEPAATDTGWSAERARERMTAYQLGTRDGRAAR